MTSIEEPSPLRSGWQKLPLFKILLLHENDWPPHARTSRIIQEAASSVQATGMRAVSVVAAYLKHLWEAFIAGGHFQRGLPRDLCLQLAMTVPSHWPPDAVKRMKMAVAESEILSSWPQGSCAVYMHEPEAAATCALTDLAVGGEAAGGPAVRILPRPSTSDWQRCADLPKPGGRLGRCMRLWRADSGMFMLFPSS